MTRPKSIILERLEAKAQITGEPVKSVQKVTAKALREARDRIDVAQKELEDARSAYDFLLMSARNKDGT